MIVKKYELVIIKWSICILFLSIVFSSAQSKHFERISLEDGLSHASVYTIIQDRYGFLWFGTLNGLNKFDGYQFTVYKADSDDPNSLSESFINSIVEDADGNLWIGTFAEGVNKFDPSTEKFTRYFNNPDSTLDLLNCRIHLLYIDDTDPDILWIGTSSKGLIAFNTKNGTYQVFQHQSGNNQSLSHNNITCMIKDTSGNQKILWIGTMGGGLNKLNLQSGKVFHYKNEKNNPSTLSNDNISKIFQDPQKESILWIGTDAGLNKFDKKTGKFVRYLNNPDNPASISDNRVYQFFYDRDGNFWIGTNNGLNIMNREEGTFEHFFYNPSLKNTLSQNSIFSIFQDKSGIIWIGTDNGLNKYDPLKQRFRLYQNVPGDESSLGQNYVRDMVRDPRDKDIYWIATHGGGLERFDYKSGTFIHYRHSETDGNSVGSNEIYDLCIDKRNNLWIAHADGLDFMNLRTGEISHFPNNSSYGLTKKNSEIITLFEDNDSVLWIGTWGDGIRRMNLNKFYDNKKDPKKSSMYLFDQKDKATVELNDNSVVWFFEDDSGIIWIATVHGGINLWNKNTGNMTYLTHEIGNPESVSHDYVTVIFQSRSKQIWVATRGGGLNKYNATRHSFKHFREKDGLASDAVVGIQEDHNGILWLNTVNGLSRFDPVTETFRNYDRHDGLQSNQFYGLSYFDRDKGIMFVGGIKGLNSFDPDKLPDNEYIPSQVFTKFIKQDTESKKYRLIHIPGIHMEKEIQLSHNDDFISIEFASMDFHNTQKNQFQYRLVPLKNKWIQLGNRNRITFTNLDPGNYDLQIRGSNDDGKWNFTGTSLKLSISPPWWRTNLAYFFYVILFLSLILGVDRYQRKRIVRREREKAKRQKEELIMSQAEELKLLDNIVRIINREFDLEKVLIALLEQGLKLFPQAENGAVLLHDAESQHFKFAANVGYDNYDLEKLFFSKEEMTGKYAEDAEEVEKGVYLVRNFRNTENVDKLKYVPIPKSMILMSATWDRKLEGFIIFSNLTRNDAFDQSDARKLKRFKQHAISAIVKARILNELRIKNDKILKTQEQLVTQQKLASLGQLTAGIAHEIKNPLNFVNNFAEISTELVGELEEKLKSQKNNIPSEIFKESQELLHMLKENAEKINQHGKRADGIVRSMLLHSRGQSGVFQETDLNAMLEESLNLAYHGMRAQDSAFNVELEKDLDDSIGKVMMVPQNLNRVFLNILQNAFYAVNAMDIKNKTINTSDKNSLLVKREGEVKKKNPLVRVKTTNKGSHIEISIWDNGRGIPESIQNQIFDPFFSTKPVGEGTGLGLSIAHEIVKHEHNGEINFHTKKNEFTEFIITIPVSKE